MVANLSELKGLIENCRENPADLAHWQVAADALRDAGNTGAADCFEAVSKGGKASILKIITAADGADVEITARVDRCNGRRRERLVSSAGICEAVGRRVRGERSDLIEVDGGGVANSYKYMASSTAVCGGVIRLCARRWLVVIWAGEMGTSGRHVSLPNPGPNRTNSHYKTGDVPGFLAAALMASAPAPAPKPQ